MCSGQPDETKTVAINQLEALGLSTYAARTYVSLTTLGEGTAREVSNSSEVPRTRVYDAIEELQEKRLVEIRETTPKQFNPVPPETAGKQFHEEYTRRINSLLEALEKDGGATPAAQQLDVWTLRGQQAITEQTVQLIGTASDEVIYLSSREQIAEKITEQLQTVSRDVSIRLEDGSETHQLEDHTQPVESAIDWDQIPAGRLLLVDREKALVSVLDTDDSESKTDEETAIWTTGETNGLSTVLSSFLTLIAVRW